jgi:anti-sigma regulatory factor (Ser/Thr protein kinase)
VVRTGNALELQFPARPESLAMIRVRLRGWLAGVGAGRDETSDLLVAFGEACTNAVEHGSSVEAWIHVRGRMLLDDVVRLSVRDTGGWRLKRDEGGNRGRGLLLLRRLVDNVAVRRYHDGSEVILYHRLQTAGSRGATMDLQSEEAWHAEHAEGAH